ncbi:hypothetical protein [Mesorhizobium sp.]|uniref:hypothetical protein n=1 Tax=Mesorhizobium sp. TaxID=1871066 RepID=UPI00121FEC36|nr:hypothetical protein [Mesorhizobium sp.]TIS53302.1 MAG: hypothetical protein E5W91_31690 [Mesorhizobium sp.]TIS85617.1 MAG: hypothetical protein E5W89_32475 [Mesorhizobium sp.]
MRNILIAALAILIPATANAGADPDQQIKWENIGNWAITVSKNTGVCVAGSNFDGGTFMGISVKNDGTAGLLVTNNLWKDDFFKGGKYAVVLELDGRAETLTGYATDDGALFFGVTPAFIVDFALKDAFGISFYGNSMGRYSLAYTKRAVGSLIACQQSIDEASIGSADRSVSY